MEGDYLKRFNAAVDRSGGVRACWPWRKGKTGAGYGETWDGRSVLLAHRVAYELWVGPIPTGLVIDHVCNNKACVNPRHLRATTDRVNVLRADGPTAINARKTHCKRGHPFAGDNLRISSNGSRRCVACQAMRNAARPAKSAGRTGTRRVDIDTTQVVAAYLDGDSMRAIGRAHGADHHVIARILRRAGVR